MSHCRFLLTDSELESMSYSIVTPDGDEVSGVAEVGQNQFQARLMVKGKAMSVWLFEPKPWREVSWQFYNDLQDFISETDFAWGQLRGPIWIWDDRLGMPPSGANKSASY